MPMKRSLPEIYVASDYDSFCREAATLFLMAVDDSIISKGGCSVAISGGATPRKFHELLAGGTFSKASQAILRLTLQPWFNP
jgi:6-phosphogluconolactonase/glucosamine-6-phosphate isomerase/deaminase